MKRKQMACLITISKLVSLKVILMISHVRSFVLIGQIHVMVNNIFHWISLYLIELTEREISVVITIECFFVSGEYLITQPIA